MKLFVTAVFGVYNENNQLIDCRFAWCTITVQQPLNSDYGHDIGRWIQSERERSFQLSRISSQEIIKINLLSQSHCVVP